MNKYIVTLGGGELKDNETFEMDSVIVELAKENFKTNRVKALFIPTASNDSSGYRNVFAYVYGELFNCEVDFLNLIEDSLTDREIEEKIMNAHLIYVGGGNTKNMIRIWKEKGVDSLLKSAYERGIVMSGLSAGSICWYEEGHSDSEIYDGSGGTYIITSGLGILKAGHCPHYNEIGRKETLDDLMKDSPLPYVCLDDYAGLVYKNDTFKLIKSRYDAKGYVKKSIDGEIITKEIVNGDYVDVNWINEF